MTTQEQITLMNQANINFSGMIPNDTDIIFVEEFDQGFGKKAFYYLYTNEGKLRDIQYSNKIVIPKNNFKPKSVTSVQQGPIKQGRTKKIEVKETEKPKVIIKKKMPKKKKDIIPSKVDWSVDNDLKKRVQIFLERKRKEND